MQLKNTFCRLVKHISSSKYHSASNNIIGRKFSIEKQLEEQLLVNEYARSNKSIQAYVWGLMEHGALGYGQKSKENKTNYLHKPSRMSFGEQINIHDIACGNGFTIFTTNNTDITNQVFGCGINKDSQIGYHEAHRIHPLELLIYPSPIALPKSINKIISAAAGRAHTLLLSDSGDVYSLGNNAFGQCGRTIVPDEKYIGSQLINHVKNLPSVKYVECGMDNSLFLTNEGQVFSCGLGTDGQTGLGIFNPQSQPKLVGENTEFSKKKIIKITSSADCVLALSDEGELFGWGNNEYGQLVGIEDIQLAVPYTLKHKVSGKIIDIAVGGSFCLVLNDQGEVYTWGFGLVGLGPNANHIPKPTLIPPALFGCPITQIVAGLAHCGAISHIGQLFMWGRNNSGQLGVGSNLNQPFPLAVPVGAEVVKLSLGVDHSVALCRSSC